MRSVHTMINPYLILFYPVLCVFIDDGVRVFVGPWRGFKFAVSLRASEIEFRAFSSRRSSLTETFLESCIDFEVTHLSALVVRRLP